jgi:glycolate oxidase FAD binding subunit
MTDQDDSEYLQKSVRDAYHSETPIQLIGSGSKRFYGRQPGPHPLLSLINHRGIINYQPTELVITARGGTPLKEIEETLLAQGQMLPFEPPHFEDKGTIGGAIAAGLGGPRRPWGGAPRDLLLGIKLLDGQGRILKFGGEVMKNVAGYDISRLMAGAMGTFGILLEVSLKVLPSPPEEHTLSFSSSFDTAHTLITHMLNEAIPISATYSLEENHTLRLACGEPRLHQIQRKFKLLQNPLPAQREDFWQQLRDQRLEFFQHSDPLWRLSTPPAVRIELQEPTLIEWAGAQRWLFSQRPATEIRSLAEDYGGHAVLFRHGDRNSDVFHPLPPRITALQQGLKAVFDPKKLFNPGRHYPNY